MNKSATQTQKGKTRKPVFAKKSLGQNFLVDQKYIEKIISALKPQSGELIIEIGAGRGALTGKLLESGANVAAVELDRDLIPILSGQFGSYKNFTLIAQNALEINFAEIAGTSKSVKLVANLPYYISTAILQKIIEQSHLFDELVLMLQREVVERITALPGNKERGFLTVLVEANFTADKLFDVPPAAFKPMPKVWSSVARLISKKVGEINVTDKIFFREIVSLGFAQKRKTILNNLKNSKNEMNEKIENKGGAAKILEQLDIAQNRRAESLTLAEWQSICQFLLN